MIYDLSANPIIAHMNYYYSKYKELLHYFYYILMYIHMANLVITG